MPIYSSGAVIHYLLEIEIYRYRYTDSYSYLLYCFNEDQFGFLPKR